MRGGSGAFLFHTVIRAASGLRSPLYALDRTFCRLLGTIPFGAASGALISYFPMKVALPYRHRLSPNRRRALELLASSPNGATTELLILIHRISRDTIAGLVRTRLATAQREIARGGGKTITVRRYRITNAGRQALEQ